MKKSVRIWNMAMAALLALAFAFMWPPANSGSPSPSDHTAQAEAHTQHADAKPSGQHSFLTVQMDADCAAAAAGCCMMAHCCPGISVGAHEMTKLATSDVTKAAEAVRGLGSDPGVVLPPPRRFAL
jgi:hypothetical protein